MLKSENMKGLSRVKNFDSGDFKCIKCGKEITMRFNGGELDENECCGIVYRTEHQQIDLIIYEK